MILAQPDVHPTNTWRFPVSHLPNHLLFLIFLTLTGIGSSLIHRLNSLVHLLYFGTQVCCRSLGPVSTLWISPRSRKPVARSSGCSLDLSSQIGSCSMIPLVHLSIPTAQLALTPANGWAVGCSLIGIGSPLIHRLKPLIHRPISLGSRVFTLYLPSICSSPHPQRSLPSLATDV